MRAEVLPPCYRYKKYNVYLEQSQYTEESLLFFNLCLVKKSAKAHEQRKVVFLVRQIARKTVYFFYMFPRKKPLVDLEETKYNRVTKLLVSPQ